MFADCIVLTAGDGQAAVLIIAAERPSVVLLDLYMPLMSGLEVLHALKDVEFTPLFIMLTGNDDLEIAQKALGMGATSYITKPFEADVIREVVMSALKEREGGGKTSARPWRVKKAGE